MPVDALHAAVEQAEKELALVEPQYVWMATMDYGYEGIEVLGVYRTIEGAKARCEKHHKAPISTWYALTYVEDEKTVHAETSDPGNVAHVITRMEIEP